MPYPIREVKYDPTKESFQAQAPGDKPSWLTIDEGLPDTMVETSDTEQLLYERFYFDEAPNY